MRKRPLERKATASPYSRKLTGMIWRSILTNHTVYLDMKDFSHPLSLAAFFNNKQINQLEKYREDHVYIVIPQYRNKVYPGFARLVKLALMPHARRLRIMNEKDVLAILEWGDGK
jgi:hypothetical protein